MRVERFLGVTPKMNGRERGQILLLVALMMVGLLVAAGLAVDAGLLMMRKSQFDRAVDAAALAGAPEATVSNLEPANTKGMQFLAANGYVITTNANCNTGVLPAPNPPTVPINYYCGSYDVGTFPGSVRYRVVARWNVPLFFMPLININTVPLTSGAVAEYYSMVDLYASDTGSTGLLKSYDLELFGPGSVSSGGDPYTPSSSAWWNELQGAYPYRIAIPQTYAYNKIRVEIFDPDSMNRSIDTSASSNEDRAWRYDNGNSTKGAACPSQLGPCAYNMADTFGLSSFADDPFWFQRVEEVRTGSAGTPGGGYSANLGLHTGTLFRLFYYQKQPDGSLGEVDLAYYLGKRDGDTSTYYPSTGRNGSQEAAVTDMTWVSPGAPCGGPVNAPDYLNTSSTGCELMPPFNDVALTTGTPKLNVGGEPRTAVESCTSYTSTSCSGNGDFIIDLSTETPGIYVDPNSKLRHIYMQVIGVNGSSENGYALWAGPARSEDASMEVPANINARQVYILRQQLDPPRGTNTVYHSSTGLVVYGMGHLPMNQNEDNRNEVALAYLGPEYAGLDMKVQFFDLDVGPVAPVIFYFDDPATQDDWSVCFGSNAQCNSYVIQKPLPPNWGNGVANNLWLDFDFTIPSEGAVAPLPSLPFYGGRLYVSYQDASNDTFGVKITVKSRPTLVG